DNELTLPLVIFKLVDNDPTSVDSWVDSAPTALFVAFRPVDNELTLPLVVFTLVDNEPTSVDSWVDSAPRALLVVFRPVDSELTPLCAVLMPT
ncbi:hypothetical protein DF132_36070, partial [Burkholderia cenocepacia]